MYALLMLEPLTRVLTRQDADLTAYAALRQEMLIDSPWSFASSPGDDVNAQPEYLRKALGTPGRGPEIMVVDASDRSRLLASAGVYRESKRKRSHIAWVWGVYTTPAARNRGYGRAVVAAAVAAARGWAGVERVCLSVSAAAPGARRVYESLGFVAWGVEPDRLRLEPSEGGSGRRFDEVYMSMALETGGVS
jgi:RimJ/RimL family protein N-acetyltransferase